MVNKMPSTAKFCKKMSSALKLCNKISSAVKFCNRIGMQSKTEKIEEIEFLKNKENFLNLKGYSIKVGEDTYILFEKEEDYLELFYLEKVFF